jgi:hypothetical protein
MNCSSDYVSPITSLDMAARLNNQGAELLGTGDFKQARDLFRKALASVTQSVRTSLKSSSNNGNCQESCFQGAAVEYSAIFQKHIPQQELANAPGGTTSTAIYSQAIPVISMICPSYDEALSQSLTSACCIFNLALIYHLRGTPQMKPSVSSSKQEGGNQREQLLKARALYDKCFGLVFSHGLRCLVGSHPIADLISMALLNNHAHVSYELACYDSALSCVDGLLYVASLVNPNGYGNQEVDAVINIAKQNFCLNTFMLRPPSVAHAA